MPLFPTTFPTPNGSTCTLLLGDTFGLAILAESTGTPPTTANVFQIGCKIIQTDAATTVVSSFTNTGTAAVPVWTRDISSGNVNSGINTLNVAHAIYSFATDGGGAPGLITPALNATIPANAIMVGATINATTAAVSGGATNISVGTSAGSSATSILAATAKASFSLGALLNGVPVFATPVKMSAAGQITLTTSTTALSAGIFEIFVYYTIAANA